MRSFFTNILKKVLKKLAQWTLRRYQPGIIAITGSVGKTSSKTAIYTVLGGVRRARMASGNFNNEIGVPLTILGDWRKVGGWWFWPWVFFISLIRLIIKFRYPEILILEYAADRPGDIRYLLEISRPQIGLITAIGDIPAHVEFFSGPEAVAREKSRLVENLPANGFAILNADDAAVIEMKNRTRAHIMTFGFIDESEVRITNFENRYIGGKPLGLYFKLNYGGSFVPVRIDGVLGKSQAYAAAAAASVGLVFGLNLVRIAENLQNYKPAQGRMQLVNGIKGAYLIDDSYNASPASMRIAVDTLKNLRARRRIAILGDMLEIGQYSLRAHEEIGRQIVKVVDFLITIGPRAKFIAESALKRGLPKKNVLIFEEVTEAREDVGKLIRKGDVVLLKASRAIGLDSLVDSLREE